jgi:NADPH:quinone reductase-like Zn-dependent oxidoreductase
MTAVIGICIRLVRLTGEDHSPKKEIRALINGGKVRPMVDTVLPLSQAAETRERIARGGMRGKIVLQVSE